MRYSLISLFLFLLAKTSMAAGSNCSAGEKVIFSCAVGKGEKVVSLCASPRLSATSGTLYYRFGAPSTIELEYPSRPNGAARMFKHVHYSRPMVARTEVTFAIGSATYAVFDYYEEERGKPEFSQGVRVSVEGTKPQETILACKGAVTSHLHQLEGKVPCDAESALAQCNKSQ